MLEESCREVGGWRRERGLDRVALSVNLSAAQLQQQSFVDDLQSILAEAAFPASDLILELTESAMFHDTHTTIARLQALRALGVRIAIDDFGTGYSSLGYLRRFPVDILKIAREFIGTEDSRSDDWAFARAILALGQTLGLRVVAEGIETAEQLQALRDLGCELGQGYLFGRPADGPTVARQLWSSAPAVTGDRAIVRRTAGRPAGQPAS
jgi:EAL domain-containing protein (putative c-di-GMP-specific phosphodiesterase class I)